MYCVLECACGYLNSILYLDRWKCMYVYMYYTWCSYNFVMHLCVLCTCSFDIYIIWLYAYLLKQQLCVDIQYFDDQLANPVTRVYFLNTQHTVSQVGMPCHTPLSWTPQSVRPVLTLTPVNPSHKRKQL